MKVRCINNEVKSLIHRTLLVPLTVNQIYTVFGYDDSFTFLIFDDKKRWYRYSCDRFIPEDE